MLLHTQGRRRLSLEAASGETGPASSSSSSRAVLPRPPLLFTHPLQECGWLVSLRARFIQVFLQGLCEGANVAFWGAVTNLHL